MDLGLTKQIYLMSVVDLGLVKQIYLLSVMDLGLTKQIYLLSVVDLGLMKQIYLLSVVDLGLVKQIYLLSCHVRRLTLVCPPHPFPLCFCLPMPFPIHPVFLSSIALPILTSVFLSSIALPHPPCVSVSHCPSRPFPLCFCLPVPYVSTVNLSSPPIHMQLFTQRIFKYFLFLSSEYDNLHGATWPHTPTSHEYVKSSVHEGWGCKLQSISGLEWGGGGGGLEGSVAFLKHDAGGFLYVLQFPTLLHRSMASVPASNDTSMQFPHHNF